MSLIVSGNIVVDWIVRPVDQIRWGASVWVESMTRSIGGNGANTAFAAARLGAGVKLEGAVGTDDAGAWVLAELNTAGVDTSRVAKLDGATPTTVALVRSDGERAFLHQPGASVKALPAPLQFVTGKAAHYHLSAPFAVPAQRPHLGASLKNARDAGLSTSLDTGWDSHGEWMKALAPALPFVDLLFVNEVEARELTGSTDPEEAARAFRAYGISIVVVKLGERGCAVIADGIHLRDPAEAVVAVDSTGAGDVFAGAFLAEWLRSGDLGKSARFANWAAGRSVTLPGLAGVPETNRI